MLIRKYRETDFPDILEISRHIWDGTDYLPKLIHEYAKDSHCRPYVVEEDEKVVSIVNMNYFTPDFVWLEAMRTHPDYRNRGIATKLNLFLFQEAKTSTAKELWLSTSLDNEATAKMLAKSNFEEITLLKLWQNDTQTDDKEFTFNQGLIEGSLKSINYLDLYVNDWILEHEKSWLPVKKISEIKSIIDKQSKIMNKFPFLVNEFNIFPLNSYFVESWIKSQYIYINDKSNSIMTFKPSKEYNNSFVIGIYDLKPEVIISALHFTSKKINSETYSNNKSEMKGNVDIMLFYPNEVKIKLLNSDWVFRIMRKTLI